MAAVLGYGGAAAPCPRLPKGLLRSWGPEPPSSGAPTAVNSQGNLLGLASVCVQAHPTA